MNIFPEDADISPSKQVKFGIDPTSPRLHLGHFIPLRLIKKLRDEGHNITIILGTLTAQLGDPSGRDSTRPILSKKKVLVNAHKIKAQIQTILGSSVRYCFNHTLHRDTDLMDFLVNVVSKFTLTHMTSRNAFANRIAENQPIAMHELLVPMLQGMDSVYLRSEIEIGGQDQLFNFQIARELQEHHGQTPQACIMMPVINGTDGRKMSKSFDNCIFLDDSPNDIFGKVMSISDDVMREWYPLLTDLDFQERISWHPMDAKKELAFDIVKQIKGVESAKVAKIFFESTVQYKNRPKEIPIIHANHLIQAIQRLRDCSKAEARRLIKGGGVKLDDRIIYKTDDIDLKDGQILQVGKRSFGQIATKNEMIEGMKKLCQSLEDGTVLQTHRVTKLVKQEDGSFKRIVSDPENGLSTKIIEGE